MGFQVTCTGCGKVLNVKDEWEGKRLKCPKCSAQFPAIRTAMVHGAGGRTAGSDDEEGKDESGVGVPFMFGADDRYPRLLYWGFLAYLVLDGIAAVPLFVHVVRENPDIDYHPHRLIGWGAAILIPPGIAVAVFLAVSTAALVYAVYKLLLLGIVITSAMGTALIGESVQQGSVTFQAVWHVAGIILGVWYFWMRRD